MGIRKRPRIVPQGAEIAIGFISTWAYQIIANGHRSLFGFRIDSQVVRQADGWFQRSTRQTTHAIQPHYQKRNRNYLTPPLYNC